MTPSIVHRIHPDARVVTTVWTGPASDAEMQRSHRALYAHPTWQPGMDELVDLRQADLSAITRQGMQELAKIVAQATGDREESFRTAILAATDLGFGMARLYQGNQPDDVGTVQVFRDEAEALGWLELPNWPDPADGIPVESEPGTRAQKG
jgi:hypothetical protein